MKEKTINVPMTQTEFTALALYAIEHEADSEEMQLLSKILQHKLDRMIEHDLYTQFKTAPTEAQKEQARQEYLNKRGIRADFRW
jgi:hypothetical protein